MTEKIESRQDGDRQGVHEEKQGLPVNGIGKGFHQSDDIMVHRMAEGFHFFG
jgi:hypothetical protein